MARPSAYRIQLTEEGRGPRRSLMKREKTTGLRTDPWEHLGELEKNHFCDVEKLHKHVYQKRFSPANIPKREANQNTFMKKSESLREVNRSNNRPRARPGFVTAIQFGLAKIKNLIEGSLSGRNRPGWERE